MLFFDMQDPSLHMSSNTEKKDFMYDQETVNTIGFLTY